MRKQLILLTAITIILSNIPQACNDKPQPTVTPSVSETPLLTNQL